MNKFFCVVVVAAASAVVVVDVDDGGRRNDAEVEVTSKAPPLDLGIISIVVVVVVPASCNRKLSHKITKTTHRAARNRSVLYVIVIIFQANEL